MQRMFGSREIELRKTTTSRCSVKSLSLSINQHPDATLIQNSGRDVEISNEHVDILKKSISPESIKDL